MKLRIFVTTYAKYNEGKLGKSTYINPFRFDNKEEFEEYCLRAHSDEHDPELMYTDRSDWSVYLVQEHTISPIIWKIKELRYQFPIEAMLAYCDKESSGSYDEDAEEWAEKFEENWIQGYTSLREYCEEELIDQEVKSNVLKGDRDWVRRYIDVDKFIRDKEHEYREWGGYLFYM